MEPRNHPGGFPQISILLSKPGSVLVSADGSWGAWDASEFVYAEKEARLSSVPLYMYEYIVQIIKSI
jgi:hypothetical protein